MSPVTTTPIALKLTERINRIEPSATMAAVAEADKLRQTGVEVVDWTVGEPHFSTPQHIKDAAILAIQNNFTRYTAVGGTIELKDAIAERHAQDFGSQYKRDEVMASVGGKHVLFNAVQVVVDHGDEVILPVPYWVSFKDIVRYAGGSCVLLETDETDGFRVTAEMVARRVTARTKMIILNSPSNPSGAVMSPEDMMEREIVIGGEESGGIGYSRYLPERDGILNSLLLANVMAEEKKPLGALVAYLQKEYGPHYYGRRDLHISDEIKNATIARANSDGTSKLGNYGILKKEGMDGVKFFLDAATHRNGAESWVLFRASGTEPLLRIYAEAASPELVEEILSTSEAFVHAV